MIIHQLILLFGLIILGYLLNKTKIMDATSNERMSKFLVNAAIPATIIHSAISQKSGSDGNVLLVFAIAIGFYLIVPLLSRLVAKTLKQNRTYELMLTYSNLGFMGIPIISSIYGEEYVFYVTIFMMIFNISIFSHGVYILSKESGEKGRSFDFKTIINPGVICAVIAVILYAFHISIPKDVDNLLSSVGTITTPLAMIVIGSSLAEIPLKKVFSDKSLYVLAAIKLLIYPAIVYVILRLIIDSPIIIGISVILTSLPTAGNVSMVCSEYGGDLEKVSKGICISTLLSVLSILLWMAIFNM